MNSGKGGKYVGIEKPFVSVAVSGLSLHESTTVVSYSCCCWSSPSIRTGDPADPIVLVPVAGEAISEAFSIGVAVAASAAK